MDSSLSRNTVQLYERLSGRHILERMEYLNRIQRLGRDELLELQRSKLISMVEYANRFVPYYQRVFKEVGFQPDNLRKDLAYLNEIPILTKAIIRKNWDDLLTTEPERRRKMSKLNTSGSTGEPLVFMQDQDFQDYVTAETHYHMSWIGWKLGDRHAWIYIAPAKPKPREKIRTQIADWAWNRFQLNACSMDDEAMTVFVDRLNQQKTKLLWCCTSSLYHFARFIRSNSYKDITFDGIFTTAEVLLPGVRQYIEETFNCKIFNRYGTMELGGVACECEAHTGYHISSDNNYIEILNQGIQAKPEEIGEFVVTNLINRAMPFIRYANGDMGMWNSGKKCICGRSAPMLGSIEGRITEMFQTRDGRYVRSAFSGGFECLAHPSISKFQVIQKSLDQMVVRLIKEANIPESVLDEITQAMRKTYGDNVLVKFEYPEEIPPLPSGKHQYAVSEINKQLN